jgi:drug/metabolite transporter (DMT)-like permease
LLRWFGIFLILAGVIFVSVSSHEKESVLKWKKANSLFCV